MRIALVDDNVEFIELIEILIKNYFEQQQESVTVYKFTDGRKVLEKSEHSVNFDLYLLDIKMPQMDGLLLAESLLDRHPEATIVYLTSFEEYAFKSIKLGAFYYILKSEYQEELPRLLDRILRIRREKERTYTIKDGNKLFPVKVKDIRYLTKDGKYTVFHYKEKESSERKTLEAIYEKLPKEKFVFVGKGLIINIDHVENIQGNKITLTGNEVFKISRFYYSSAMEVLTRYLGLE